MIARREWPANEEMKNALAQGPLPKLPFGTPAAGYPPLCDAPGSYVLGE